MSTDREPILEQQHPSKSSRALNKIILAFMVVIAISLGVILRWSFANENILTVKNAPFPVRTIRPHAEANGVIILKVDLCKNSNTIGRERTSFVSSSREVFLPITDERLPKGCLNQEIPILVPKDLPADTYRIKFHVVYNVNPLKQGVTDEFTSKEFTIVTE